MSGFFTEYLALIMFGATILVMMLGFPVAFTLAGLALAFAYLGAELGVFRIAQLNFLPQRVWSIVTNSVIVAAPLFIFMGLVLERARLAEDMLIAMARLFGPRPGGFLIATSVVGALMAASTGIVGATVVTMGLLALPVMMRHGYNAAAACGAICAAGTLGQIIPPSIVLVFLGDFLTLANQQANLAMGTPTARSVGVTDLFAGALVPGLMLVGLYILLQLAVAFTTPAKAPPVPAEAIATRGDESEARLLLRALVAPVLLIVAVLGSILGGVATPTEAAGVGAAGALMLAGWKRAPHRRWVFVAGLMAAGGLLALIAGFDLRLGRSAPPLADRLAVAAAMGLVGVMGASLLTAALVTFRAGDLMNVTFRTARITAMIFTVLIGATLFTLVFRGLGGEALIRDFLAALPGGLTGAMLFTMVLMFVLGFFLDFLEIIFILVPILCPALIILGADPVWLGVMIAVNLQTSFLTPPFGFALFYLRGVAPPGVHTLDIWRGVLPYIGLQLAALALIASFPALATWLPGRL